jgi:hypothetical protein
MHLSRTDSHKVGIKLPHSQAQPPKTFGMRLARVHVVHANVYMCVNAFFVVGRMAIFHLRDIQLIS